MGLKARELSRVGLCRPRSVESHSIPCRGYAGSLDPPSIRIATAFAQHPSSSYGAVKPYNRGGLKDIPIISKAFSTLIREGNQILNSIDHYSNGLNLHYSPGSGLIKASVAACKAPCEAPQASTYSDPLTEAVADALVLINPTTIYPVILIQLASHAGVDVEVISLGSLNGG